MRSLIFSTAVSTSGPCWEPEMHANGSNRGVSVRWKSIVGALLDGDEVVPFVHVGQLAVDELAQRAGAGVFDLGDGFVRGFGAAHDAVPRGGDGVAVGAFPD